MDFDTIINRFGSHSLKWDMMERLYGVPADEGIAMWVADMDFAAPPCIQDAVGKMHAHGIYGYYGDETAYRNAICWWMANRHNWQVEPDMIFSTNGLVNGAALCVDTFTKPGDGVVLMTPVYHAFARVIHANGRRVVECALNNVEGRYQLDIDAWEAQMDGSETLLILCSPHNPGGRVWSRDELEAIAEFAKRHDLILVSDEIHHDLVFPGSKHTAMALIEGISDRLIMMTATTKTFNIAGSHVGNVIIPDVTLRKKFAGKMAALGISANSFGLNMAEAAYSPEGAAWLDQLLAYIDGNRKLFDTAINAIPGLSSMSMEATYLAWVDFSGTGMDRDEFTQRVEEDAKIVVNHGPTFGTGGENFLRFNIATPRPLVEQAIARLQHAFADLQ